MKTLKNIIFSFAFVLALGMMLAAGTDAKAATTTVTESYEQTPEVMNVGDTYNIYDGINVKINNKAVKKSRKKVRAILTDKENAGCIIPASYYEREFYNSVADYEKAKDNTTAKATCDYTFVFKKAGTYTFTWERYYSRARWVDVPGQTYKLRNVEVTKYVYTKKIKVVKDASVIKSIKLGKAKYTYNRKNSETKNSSTVVVNKYLTGTSGKLDVKLNSNYQITSILVMTYDKDGNQVYQQVNNKQTVAYGLNKYDTTLYNVETGVDMNKKSFKKNLMKKTVVFIGYKDKFTGEYSKYTIKVDPTTQEKYIEVEYQNYGKDDDGKPYPVETRKVYGSLYHNYGYSSGYSSYGNGCVKVCEFKLK